MTPKKRVKADVQKILDNPVQSDVQQVISPKKEGFWGWMSYVGWALCLWFMFNTFYGTIFIDNNRYLIFSGDWIFDFLKDSKYLHYTGLFFLWTVPCILFYKYPCPLLQSLSKILFFYPLCPVCFSLWIKIRYFEGAFIVFIFVYFMLLFSVLFYWFRKKIAIGTIVAFCIGSLILSDVFFEMWFDNDVYYCIMLFYILLPIPYLYYFYKKSKDGYRYVWLKALLFPLLLFIPITIKIEERYPEGLMGDILG